MATTTDGSRTAAAIDLVSARTGGAGERPGYGGHAGVRCRTLRSAKSLSRIGVQLEKARKRYRGSDIEQLLVQKHGGAVELTQVAETYTACLRGIGA